MTHDYKRHLGVYWEATGVLAITLFEKLFKRHLGGIGRYIVLFGDTLGVLGSTLTYWEALGWWCRGGILKIFLPICIINTIAILASQIYVHYGLYKLWIL